MAYFVATFPGVLQVLSCTGTLSHGIQPGVATLECVPQIGFVAGGGTLIFTDLDDPTTLIQFPDCKVDKHSIRTSSAGQVWSFSIWDRRWKWAFGGPGSGLQISGLSGHYNFKFRDGPPRIDPDHEQTPQQLATLCLDAMGEVGYDVSELPNTSRPEVDWDYEIPAKALAELVEALGCRVVLRLDNTVKIALIGLGATLPAGIGPHGPLEDSLTIDPPERPDLILVVGRAVFQQDFELEAVGLDIDGDIRLINDLSYKPIAGWNTVVPPDFEDGVMSDLAKDLAQNTVYRWYRIKVTDGEGNAIPLQGSGRVIESLDQILPIFDTLVEVYTDLDEGKIGKAPALVHGTYFDTTRGYENRVNKVYGGDFHVNMERGIVEFGDYVYLLTGGATAFTPDPADLTLRVAVSIRDKPLWAWVRYERFASYPGGPFGTGARILRHDEIQLEYVNGVVQNLAAVQAEADFFIAGADQEYQTPLPQERSYPGLVMISPDGAIAQVGWSVSSSNIATTHASRNTEFSSVTHPYPMRRVWDYLRGGGLKELLKAEKKLEQRRDERRGGHGAQGK